MRRLLLGVSALAFVVVVQFLSATEVPPQAVEELQVLADATQTRSFFGNALAADDNTLVVGAPGLDSLSGGVFVYTRGPGDTWEYLTTLTASDRQPADQFGQAVDVDGDTIVVGSPTDHGAVIDQGSVYVFTRTDGTWSQTAHLLPIVAQNGAEFGGAVAVEGDRIVVGAYNETVTVGSVTNNRQGAAYVYTRNQGTWSLTAILRDLSGHAYDHFGQAVAIAGDTFVIGAPDADAGGQQDCGKAYLFTLGARPQPASLLVGPGEWAHLGASFGVGAPMGSYWPLAIGAPGYEPTVGCTNCGGAYLYDLNDPLAPPHVLASYLPDVDDGFGTSLSVWGSDLLVGSPMADYGGGRVEWFAFQGTGWVHVDTMSRSNYGAGRLGSTVAVSGSSAIGGAPSLMVQGVNERGAVWVFGLGPVVTSVTPNHGPMTGGTSLTISGAHFDPGVTATLGGVPITTSGSALPYRLVGLTPPRQVPEWTALQVQNVNGRHVVVPNAFRYYWRVDDISPAVGAPGVTCTISGAGFPCTGNSVYFGASQAQIQSCSDSALVVTVPVFTHPTAAAGPAAAAIPVDVFVNGPDDGQVVVENGFSYASGDLLLFALVAPVATGPGSTLSVTDKTKNLGPDDLPPSTTRYYLSADATLDGGDLLLGARDVPALVPRVMNVAVVNLPIGPNQAAGAYWLIAKADAPGAIAERSEANNVKARPLKIGADLLVSTLAAPLSVTRGVSFNLTEATKNTGPGGAPASTTRVVLSTDAVPDAGDTLLYNRAVAALAKGALSRVVTPTVLDQGLAPGMYFLLAAADVLGVVPEESEANNTRAKKIVVK